MSRVLIIGASSFVGSHIARGMRDEYEVIGTYNRHKVRIDGIVPLRMPIAPAANIPEWIRTIRPDVVVYSAAVIDDRQIQQDPGAALFVNSEAPLMIAEEVKRMGGRFFYLSTAKVFSGAHEGHYCEDDEPTPTGPYGQTKRRAEIALEPVDHAIVLRLGTIFGLGSHRQGSDIVSRMLRKLWRREQQRLIFDEYRSFFPAESVALGIKKLLNAKEITRGVFHLAGPDKDSYFSFAKTLALQFGFPHDSLMPVKGEEFAGEQASAGGARGTDLTLDGTRFADTLHMRWDTLSDSMMSLRRSLKTGF